MKRLSQLCGIFLTVAASLSACAGAAPVSKTDGARSLLLSNFRDNPIGKAPEFWSTWCRKGMLFSAEVTESDGRRVAHLSSNGKQDWAFTRSRIVPVSPGLRVRLSCRAKSNDGHRGAVFLQLTGLRNRKLVSFALINQPLDHLSGEWERYSATLVLPSNVDSVGIRFQGRGTCDLLVDDILLEALPPEKRIPRPVRGFATERVTEKLDRGLVAFQTPEGDYLSWRLLASDDPQIGFDLLRHSEDGTTKLNPSPLVQTTDFLVENPVPGSIYELRPAAGFSGVSGKAEARPNPGPRSPCAVYRLSDPLAQVNKIGIGDLDGDGTYDFVARYGAPGIDMWKSNVDPWYTLWKPSTHPFVLEALRSDGKLLWRKNLGWNLESGIWYSPFLVYDVNGDGRAEVILKAFAPEAGDLREKSGENRGKVVRGEEFLMVWDGLTGREIARAPWPSREPFLNQKMAYNFYSRNQLAVAYLDGKTPCIIALRGTYNIMLAEAWQLKDNTLRQLWQYDSRRYGREYRGQGAHTTRTVDLDGDGRDEIVLGGAVLDDDGQPLWSSGHGHPDHIFVTDVTNTNPGLEILALYESPCLTGGFSCADARTGRILWELSESSRHIHFGYAGDIDPRYRGWEVGGVDILGGKPGGPKPIVRHFSPEGKLLYSGDAAPYRKSRHFLYWDADLQREDATPIVCDFNGGPSGGGFVGKFLMQADILGDWREEALTVLNGEFRVYSTTIPAMDRRICLMQDPAYRQTIAANSMGYLLDPALSYLPTNRSPNLNLTFRQTGENSRLEIVVSAPLQTPLKGTLVISGEGDCLPSPLRREIDLKAGESTLRQEFLPENTSPGKRIHAKLTLLDGRVLRGGCLTGVAPFQPDEGCILLEAEAFSEATGPRVKIRSDKPGAHGKSISHWDKKEQTLFWQFAVPVAGQYRLEARFATNDDARRTLIVDGVESGWLNFPATGGLGAGPAEWLTFPPLRNGAAVTLSLTAGTHCLGLRNIDGAPLNLDCLLLKPVP